ncbi:hypothetical protein AGOR_G00212730 [Albula goreensis]|uniref:B-cell receptor CD22 n=1 Tax=Albula goreensis TaxID=1534307 RepID=A0A8T3CUM1_9TELE|nr:hypothetical protein AGOR_G00212730 [Albula goreensis]
MGLRDTLYFWSLTLLTLPGVLGANWGVWYPDKPVCAVRGSTVIIPCSYSYPQSDQHGNVTVKRVMWCHNNRNCIESEYVCHSNNTNINPEFKSRAEYLGNTPNCTLKIKNIMSQDSGTYRFRFEAEKEEHKWTGQEGVKLKVTELTVTVTSSRGNETVREGDSVTLTCIAKNCSLGQSELTWLKDKQHLPGTNATLEFSPFYSRHSGIYACAVKDNLKFTSPEIQLGNNHGAAFIVAGVLLPVVAGALVIIVCVRRRRTKSNKDSDRTGNTQRVQAVQDDGGSLNAELKTLPPAERQSQEEEVSYSTLHFHTTASTHNPAVQENQDNAVIYSSVSRGE